MPPWTGRTSYRVRLRVPRLPLIKGEFTLWAFLADERGIHVYDRKVIPAAFHVYSESYRFGLIDIAHEWEPELAVSEPERATEPALPSSAG